ncbi:hypothetical protein EJB05_47030, partial [Eragrostis curvula]
MPIALRIVSSSFRLTLNTSSPMPTHDYVSFSSLEWFRNLKEEEGVPKNNRNGRRQENIEDIYIQGVQDPFE